MTSVTVSEYVRKIQVLKSPEERQLRISRIPEIHTDTETGPIFNSEDAKSSGNSTKGIYMRLGGPGNVIRPSFSSLSLSLPPLSLSFRILRDADHIMQMNMLV